MKNWLLGALAATLFVEGCALLRAMPPEVVVQQVALRGIGLLDQILTVSLCVSNLNDSELDFRRVNLVVDIAGFPLADSTSETPVLLPPRASTLVPFRVVTTVRNLGPQLLAILNAGGVDYRLHGTVQFTGVLAITLPFSHIGRLDPLAAAEGLLTDAAASIGARCPQGTF